MWPVKKQYFMYVAVPEIELSDSVSLSVTGTAPTHSLSPSVVRGTSNCDFTLQCVKQCTMFAMYTAGHWRRQMCF